jgi:type VI secretion system secreted protein VgrG
MFDNMPDLDVLSFLKAALVILALGVVFSFWAGIRSIRSSRSLPYFRLRRDRLVLGWRMILIAVLMAVVVGVLSIYGEPLAYRIYPITTTPSLTPTPSLAPSLTPVPSMTLSPTITPTLAESLTPTITPTPYMPLAIEAQFEALVTPPAGAVFSELTIAQGFDALYRPINPNTNFTNPVGHMYALFSYDQMVDGVQWTALWYRDGELVHYETLVWDGGIGGFGFTDWDPDPEEWLPGNYQVQIFIGTEFKVLGEFVIEGDPVSSSPTATPTLTITLTLTPTLTVQATVTPTITLSPTPYPTLTRTIKPTPYPTLTRTPTATPSP